MSRRVERCLLCAAAAGALAACAPRQHIPLHCVPQSVTVYLDREALPAPPAELELRADRDHTLFFKGGGYKPGMIVLRTVETEDGPRLMPDDVCLELDFVEVRRDLELEVEGPRER